MDLSRQVRSGEAGQSLAWHGIARQARRGPALRGEVGRGIAGKAGPGAARSGAARRGVTWPAGRCEARLDMARQARPGEAGPGRAGHGRARRGNPLEFGRDRKEIQMQGIKVVELKLRGIAGSPLVVHAFAEKAKKEIRDKQQKKAKKAKEERNPEAEFLAARYIDSEGRECVPVTAIKKALVSAATAFDSLTKVALRQALFVSPAAAPTQDLVPIETHAGTPAVGEMREDAVTIGINTRGLAYRPAYREWQVRVRIEYNPRLVSEEQLLALVDQAGWGVGICEGRPERSSALGWGRFERAAEEEPEEH